MLSFLKSIFYKGDKKNLEDLQHGILFEDNGIFLEWYKAIDMLAETFSAKKDRRAADRTIYCWGKHTILNGLELELETMFWNTGRKFFKRRFTEIRFFIVGDEISQKWFNIISEHLDSNYNVIKKIETIHGDISHEWRIGKVNLQLYLFEQFVYKLSFTISRRK